MEFTPEIIDEIKFYVYSYSDPDTEIPFYIGKGYGNRCFQHLNDQSESEKVKKLEELKKSGKKPLIELLRYGLTEREASLLEATLIDYIDLKNLTNKVRGLHSKSQGRTLVEDIVLKYSAEEINIEDEDDKVILISIGRSYNRRMSDEELYEYSRGVWKVNEEKHKAELALIVFQGVIREVYRIIKWHKAGTLVYKTRDSSSFSSLKRREFEGEKAEDSIRNKYISKSVRQYWANGNRNPIRYVNC